MNYLIHKALVLVLLAFAAIPAQATIVYSVSSTSQINCGGSPHGLWTNADFGGSSCANYFDIDGTFIIDNSNADSSLWTANLAATATNPDSVIANIVLGFTGYTEDDSTITNIKNGGGGDPSTWSFFNTVSGFISFDSPSNYGKTQFFIDGMVPGFAFQIGNGANDKTSAFGGSAWIQTQNQAPAYSMNSDHWDLNLDFVAVPEPMTMALLGLGLFGLGMTRKKNA